MAESSSDIENAEHEPEPKAKKTVVHGTTSGGVVVALLVLADGTIVTS